MKKGTDLSLYENVKNSLFERLLFLLAKLQNTLQLKWTFKSCYRSPAVDIIYILSIYKPHEIYRFLLCSPCWYLVLLSMSRNAKRAAHEYSSFFYPCAETSKLNMYIPCSIIHELQRKSCYTWIFLVLLSMCWNKQVKHVYTLFYHPWAETSICIFLVLRNTNFSNALKNNILQLFLPY